MAKELLLNYYNQDLVLYNKFKKNVHIVVEKEKLSIKNVMFVLEKKLLRDLKINIFTLKKEFHMINRSDMKAMEMNILINRLLI